MPEPFIQISSLVKTYATPAGPLNVLRGIDIELARGEFVALVGPAGGGKTTFLNMITGVDKPTSGEVIVDGVDVSKSPEGKLTRWRGRNVGIVFQFFHWLDFLSSRPKILSRLCGSHIGCRKAIAGLLSTNYQTLTTVR